MTSGFRGWAPYGWMAAAFAVVNLAWVGLARYDAGRAFERTIQARRHRGSGVPAGTGTGVRITHFYAGSGEIVRGQHAVVCYGVENATAVRLEPPQEPLAPAMNRCFAVAPGTDTTYTLFATGAGGQEVSESFTIRVAPPPPNILFIALNKTELRRGEKLTLCYGVENAASVRLDPLGWKLPPSRKFCTMYIPGATMRYTFTATSPEGRMDQERFTIKVM